MTPLTQVIEPAPEIGTLGTIQAWCIPCLSRRIAKKAVHCT